MKQRPRSLLMHGLVLLCALGVHAWAPRLAHAEPARELSVSVQGSGSVTRIPDRPLYLDGSYVTVIAVPATNWHFIQWSGAATSTDPTVTVLMDADKALVATFEIYPDSLHVTSVGGGSVVLSPPGPAYPAGTVVQVVAVSNDFFHFSHWSGDTATLGNPLVVTTHGTSSYVATFTPDNPLVTLPEGFSQDEIVSDIDQPVGMAFLPDARLLFVERQTAAIRMLVDGHLSTIDPVCVVDSVQSQDGEQGLLGIAVDPQWPERPFIYVSYTALGHTIRLTRFEATGNLHDGRSDSLFIDPASRYDVLRNIEDLLEFHNGGGIHFGPDGMLYYALGDDGDECAAQDTTRLKGVILRLDVRALPPGAGGPPTRESLVPPDNPFATEDPVDRRMVFAEGMRNPFSFSVDPHDGSLFVADVGYMTCEEIDHIAAPGNNFGWPLLEGVHVYSPQCGETETGKEYTLPIAYYYRQNLPAAVISGGLYQGGSCAACNFPPEYEGDYFYSDFHLGFIRRLKRVNGAWGPAPVVPGQPNPTDWALGMPEIAAYAMGPDGALWYCRTSYDFNPGSGSIGRIVHEGSFVGVGPAPAAASALSFAAPFPSPARDRVHFEFTLPAAARVELALFDVTGRRARVLLEPGRRQGGVHDVMWDGTTDSGSRAAPGVYLARLTSGESTVTRRVIMVR